MWIPRAALAACLASCAAVCAAEPLTLDAALARIVASHPELRALDLQGEALRAEQQRAAQSAPLHLAADAENFAGTGTRSGIQSAEWTLSLAGVLERGGKRSLREALAAQRIDALAPRRAAAALALLAEAAQRYLDVVAAEGEQVLARDELRERERWRDLARARAAAGAMTQTLPLLADANVARARFELNLATTQRALAWRRLALLWGEVLDADATGGEIAPVDPLALPPAPAAGDLRALLARNPGIAAFAAETRVRESRLRLAEAARAGDIAWRAGVRRLEEGDDWAFIAGVSLPLGARGRAEPEQQAARAELDALAFEHEATERRLLGLLLEAQGVHAAALLQVQWLRDEVLPRYAAAGEAAERAWRAGALSPIEWSELQSQRLAARRTQLQAAIAARRALIEIQSLTAEPLRDLRSGGDLP